jgi:multisubunit Na+/H+ antiporter MnhB subunit
MTEARSLIPRIAGALIAAFVFIAILAMVLTSIQPFSLDTFAGSITSTLIPVNDYFTEGANVATMLWGYRGIDSMLQGILLVAAAIGAAALFRLERGKEEVKEE